MTGTQRISGSDVASSKANVRKLTRIEYQLGNWLAKLITLGFNS